MRGRGAARGGGSPAPAGRGARAQTAPSATAASAKRRARNTPGEVTSSALFTKWKVVPQNSVRTRSARSATALCHRRPRGAALRARARPSVPCDGAARLAGAHVQHLDARARTPSRSRCSPSRCAVPNASATSMTPMRSRNASASIFIVGWRSTKSPTAPANDEHHADGDDHRRDHDRELPSHADGGDHRVEREDDVEERDLHDDRPEGAAAALRAALLGVLHLELVVDLVRRLRDQEQAADEQDEVAAGESVAEDREERAR